MNEIFSLVSGDTTLSAIVGICICFSLIAIILRFLLWSSLRDLYQNTKKLQNQLSSDHQFIKKLEERFKQFEGSNLRRDTL